MKSGDHQFDPGREQYIPAGYFPFLKRSFYRLLAPMVEPDLSITSAVNLSGYVIYLAGMKSLI